MVKERQFARPAAEQVKQIALGVMEQGSKPVVHAQALERNIGMTMDMTMLMGESTITIMIGFLAKNVMKPAK